MNLTDMDEGDAMGSDKMNWQRQIDDRNSHQLGCPVIEEADDQNKMRALSCALTVLCLFSFCLSYMRRERMNMIISAGGVFLIWLPWLAEKVLRIRLSNFLKSLFMIYSIAGPVGGQVYRFYYLFSWWDKLMHAMTGFLFAGIGFALPDILDRRPGRSLSLSLRLIMAICFSMTIAVAWECYEFALDVFFVTDLQNDRVITSIASYHLGMENGNPVVIDQITKVEVNGIDLGLGGYLDIGLYDTMYDMLIHAIGAALFCAIGYFRGRKENSRFIKTFVPKVLNIDEAA